MIAGLSPEQLQVIGTIVAKTEPDLADQVRRGPSQWDRNLKRRISQLVGDELAQEGFDADYVPNARGHILIAIIDRLGELD